MGDQSVSFRPMRDIRSQRWVHTFQFVTASFWVVMGSRTAVTATSTTLAVLGAVFGVSGVVLVALFLIGRRAGLDVDAAGVRWRNGLGSSRSVHWDEVERVVVEDRGSPYGSKIGIEVQTAGGERRGVPDDALAGLEDRKHAELRRHVLGSVVRCAKEAGVAAVITPSGDDPLIV